MIPAELIKERVTVPMLLEQYGVKPNRSGRCRCPIHNGHDYNMAVKERSYRCFVCGSSGTVIDLQMALTGHTLDQAVEDLNSLFGLGLANHKRSASIAAEMLRYDRAERRRMEQAVKEWNDRQYDAIAKARRLRWERGGDCDEIDAALDALDFTEPIPHAATLAMNHGLVRELVEVTHGTVRPDDAGKAPPG